MLILVHGLGQDKNSWAKVSKNLHQESVALSLPSISDFDSLYKIFEEECNKFEEKLTLCGLSLGGLLSLKYAINNPHKINKLILIATPYKIPRFLFSIQSTIFRMLPISFFKKMNQSKENVLSLTNSLKNINLEDNLNDIATETLVVVGEKDFANKKSSKKMSQLLSKSTLEIIQSSGHEVNIDNPQDLAKTINNFLRDSKC
ncbi:MAG: alpha/beta hydrolase [bacterium]|nr:alpha/beta hydrolase [bacterium]